MQVLTMDEVEAVSGAMSTNQCIGMYSLIGGVTGAIGGGLLGAGVGALGGGGLGLGIGAAFGMIVCD